MVMLRTWVGNFQDDKILYTASLFNCGKKCDWGKKKVEITLKLKLNYNHFKW